MSGITIEGTYNARWTPLAPGAAPWLARAASLDGVDETDGARLAELGIALVLDLRESTERAVPRHGVDVAHVALYRLPDGPPQSGSLEQVYDFLLRERAPRLAEAVAAIAEAPGPVLVHCTAGKDRTGLVVALALLATGHSGADVVADYTRSAGVVRARREHIAERALEGLALDPAARAESLRLHLDSPAEAMQHALRTIAGLGGAEALLLGNGMTAGQLESLRRVLGGPA